MADEQNENAEEWSGHLRFKPMSVVTEKKTEGSEINS